MWQFLFPAFVAGAATFTVPVVIHLIFRMRKRRVVFSSLRFLQQSVLRETRKLRLREIILLLLRCAACILLALSFARPFRPNAALAGANGKPQEDVVLVVDDSPSLMAQEGATVRWHALTERARKEVNLHSPGEHIGLVLASEPARAEIELSGNFGSVIAELQHEKPSARRGDLAQAMNTAVEMLISSQKLARRIVLYSDLQVNQIDRGAWATLAQKAAAAGRGITIQVDTPSGVQPARLPNLAVTDVNPRSDVWIEGRPIPFSVRVANNGDNESPSVPVKLVVDDKVLATRTIALSPHTSTEIEMSVLLPHAGEVSGYAEIEAHDAMPEDDRRLFAVHLRDSIKVLVIEEKLRDKDSYLDEGYYVRMALDPKARGGDAGFNSSSGGSSTAAPAPMVASYVQVQSVTAAQVTQEMYRNCDLIVLVGIFELAPKTLRDLEEAVAEGHNLMLFAGRADNRISESFYNGAFWKNGLGLLPVRPGPLYEGKRLEGKYHKLGEFKGEHALFKPFVGKDEPHLRLPRYVYHYQPDRNDLKVGASVKKEAESAPPADKDHVTTNHPEGEVLATFDDGSPFALERPYGKGNVLMFTFAPRPEATDLPKHKAFLPLLHQAVRHFAGVRTSSHRNLLAGDSFDFAEAGVTPETAVTLEKPAAATDAKTPGKENLSLTGKDHPLADLPGIYTAAFDKGSFRERTFWAVNVDPRESELISEDLAAIREIFASNTPDGKAAPGMEREWDDEQKAQAPDWRYFLVAALACLMLEGVLRDFWT